MRSVQRENVSDRLLGGWEDDLSWVLGEEEEMQQQ